MKMEVFISKLGVEIHCSEMDLFIEIQEVDVQ